MGKAITTSSDILIRLIGDIKYFNNSTIHKSPIERFGIIIISKFAVGYYKKLWLVKDDHCFSMEIPKNWRIK